MLPTATHLKSLEDSAVFRALVEDAKWLMGVYADNEPIRQRMRQS